MDFNSEYQLSANIDIDPAFFDVFCGSKIGKFTLEYQTEKQVPRRTHKKKRIRKKWIKRYGYKTILEPVKFENVSLRKVELSDDGISTFDIYF